MSQTKIIFIISFLAMGFNARQTMILILLISCIFSGINILLVSYMNNTLILLEML